MRTKLMIYNKYRQTVDQFESDLRAFATTAPEILAMQVTEHSSSDLIFTFEVGTKPAPGQNICILSGIDPRNAESIINATLEAVEQTGKQGKFLNIVTLSKSPRMLAAMVIGQVESVEAVNGVQESSAKGQATIQNEGANGSANRRSKRKLVS